MERKPVLRVSKEMLVSFKWTDQVQCDTHQHKCEEAFEGAGNFPEYLSRSTDL